MKLTFYALFRSAFRCHHDGRTYIHLHCSEISSAQQVLVSLTITVPDMQCMAWHTNALRMRYRATARMSLDMTSEEQTAITETNQAITRPLRRTAHINIHCKERLQDLRQNRMNSMSTDKDQSKRAPGTERTERVKECRISDRPGKAIHRTTVRSR